MIIRTKDIITLLLAYFACLVIVVVGSTGCRSVKKTQSSQVVINDSAAVKKNSSGQVSKADSAGRSTVQQGTKTETNSATGDKVTATFSGDTAGKAPVIIKINPDGSATIDPGGRTLNQVVFDKTKQDQKRDSTGTTRKDAAREAKQDSTWHNVSDSAGKKNLVVIENKTTSRTWPWWYYATGIVVLALAVLLIRKYWKTWL